PVVPSLFPRPSTTPLSTLSLHDALPIYDPSPPRCVAEAPAGHRVALGDAVDQKVPILQLWQDACEARRWARGVVDLVVDLVSQHPDAGIPRKDLAQCLEFL